VRGAWTHDIHCVNREKLLAREYSLGIFVGRDGKPISPPQQSVEDVIRGPHKGRES
jgi:hypothetical protein